MAGTSSDTGCKQNIQGEEIVIERNHLKQTISYERFIFTLSTEFSNFVVYTLLFTIATLMYFHKEDLDSLLVSSGCSLKELM